MSKKLKKTKIEIGAQNCHEQDSYGAFTGSVNSKMLKNIGAKYVIIGHSENRQAGESNQLINLKVKSALKSGLKVIFCIGETLKEKRKKITKKILNNQLKFGLNKVKLKAHKKHNFKNTLMKNTKINYVKINIFPDGGISRIRLFGNPKQ